MATDQMLTDCDCFVKSRNRVGDLSSISCSLSTHYLSVSPTASVVVGKMCPTTQIGRPVTARVEYAILSKVGGATATQFYIQRCVNTCSPIG